ncbi:MAG: anti-sigma factor antagonist [Anaerolineae bacterium]|uniref:anti-sigma factor antagonist n=1 Tax=Candidatus Flexifilum breve TaxID=3140694 RepID=UPI001ACB4BD0|nr:anti-sigma factor antagonist [Chloroflexota bacterium]MBN8635153.1 anti-sigma factor antagonist [Anaerolineae bacterium]
MDVQVKPFQDATVVEVVGDIDGSTAPMLQEQILAVAQPGCRLLVDMSRVGFMSSAGLRVMLILHRTISGGKGHVVLVGLSEDIKDTMSATGFLKFFTTADTLEAGLQALNNG